MERASGVTDVGYTFLREGGGSDHVPYRELVARARARGAALQAAGLKSGDRLALVLEDNQDFVITFFAAIAAGIVPVPMYPPLGLRRLTAYLDDAAGIIRTAGAAGIATSARLRTLLWPLASRVDSVRHVLVAAQLEGDAASLVPTQATADDICFLQFTSGSTAAPKGVMITHGNLMANTRCILGSLLPRSDGPERGLSWLPLYHDMGLIGFVLSPLVGQCATTLMPTLMFLKRPASWFQAMHDHRATSTFAPNFAYALAAKRIKPDEMARWDLSCVTVFGCGAEVVRADTLRRFADHFAPAGIRHEAMLPCYGMAESTLAVSFHALGTPMKVDTIDQDELRSAERAVPATGPTAVEVVGCGRAFAGHEIRVVDEDRRPVGERVVGEIELRGPSITPGYFGNAEVTRASLVDGWLRTGDLGYLAGGEMFVCGRKKDLVIIGGRNFAPDAIEVVAATVPDVRPGNVVAFARDGARGTDELVIACESKSPEHARIVEGVRARVSEELGLTVADVVVLPAGGLPKTSSGKLQRARTRARYLDGTLARSADRTAGGSDKLLLVRHLLVSVGSRVRFLWRRLR
ncbi:MAG TPA: fatty acyl-AMP ligase [Kofleriaceae bacterium]|nr:fatty acyl-AMP ligase [Kofleriaceae bacterium]